MALSVVDPLNAAIERVKHVCFRPFDLGKWFIIGFCAFLAGFVEGGASLPTNFNSNFNFGMRGEPGGKTFAADFHEAIKEVQANLAIILVIGLIVLIVGTALWALFIWLGSRGQFMFIENIVRNRGAVVAPWNEYHREGNSLFWFHFLFGLAVLAVFVAIPVAAVFIALPDIQAEKFGSAASGGLAVLITGFVVVGIVAGLISLLLNDFVVPIMYRRRIGVLAAWREFHYSMLAGHIGTFALYVLFKIVLSIAYGFFVLMVCCCTLCIALIPYLGTHVLLLPLHVFWRSYSLYFIEQFGPQWQFFSLADEITAEFIDEEDEWRDERVRPGDERIRPADDSDSPPDDRFRPE